LSRRHAIFLITGALASTSLGGCDLIFEPPHKAADRFMQALATGNRNKVEEFIERAEDVDKLRDRVLKMGGAFRSPLFQGKTEYWTIGTPVEDKATEIWQVPVTIHVPRNSKMISVSSRKTIDVDITLVMHELRLRWYVIEARDVFKLLRRVKYSR